MSNLIIVLLCPHEILFQFLNNQTQKKVKMTVFIMVYILYVKQTLNSRVVAIFDFGKYLGRYRKIKKKPTQ